MVEGIVMNEKFDMTGDNIISACFENGVFSGVRVTLGNENFVIAPRDYNDGCKYTWEEVRDFILYYTDDWTTWDYRQGCFIMAYLQEINRILKFYGGEALTDIYWTSKWINGDQAYLCNTSNGVVYLDSLTREHKLRTIKIYKSKPKIEKFDPKTLKPFDKVLVRDFLSDNWMADFFEKIEEHDIDYNAICVTSHWEQCIPYNDETKHLLGTREDCPEYYKWWKE